MSFDQVYKWAKLLAVFSVVPVMIVTAMTIWQLKGTTNQLLWATNATMTALPKQVDDRIGKVQTAVMDKIDTVQDKLNAEVTTLATLTDKRIGSLTSTTDGRLGKIQTDLVKTVNETLNAQLTTTNQSITKLADAYAGVPDAVGAKYNTQFASYFDCSKNLLCLQGQASDTMFAVRQSSRDTSTMMMGFNETMPKIEDHILTISNTFSTDLPKITTNIAGITDNINKLTKPKWYDRLLGYALNGVVIYRNLNPVTSLSVTGAQFISSQK
jgi:hypothetical protein